MIGISAKQKFLDDFLINKDKRIIKLTLLLPNGSIEQILNNMPKGKVRYIESVYSEDLTLNTNPEVKIIDYSFLD